MSAQTGGRVIRGLSRRAFLGAAVVRGTGVALALPAFESLMAGRAVAGADATAAVRMAFVYAPNGVIVKDWKPTGVGTDYTPGPTLEPLAGLRGDFQVVSGLAHRNGTAGRDGAGDHARAMATILTGTRPRKTAGSDIRAGISVDQVAAQRIGRQTRFPSLELTCDTVRRSGECDLGYSCAYSFNMSWRSETQPATPEPNPRLVFERLFGAGTGEERARNLMARLAERRSILDFVADDARRLAGRLGHDDRHKFAEYVDGIRQIERQIGRLESFGVPHAPEMELPERPPALHRDHVRLMADMMVLAFQTDSTRVATLILSSDGSNRTFPEIEVTDGHHALSHHQGDPDKIAKIARIDRFYVEQFAYLLGRLKETKDAGGRPLLDSSMVVYTSGLSDGNRHQHIDLPLILAGSGGGRLAPGRHVLLAEEQPMANLFVTMLDIVGAPVDTFGDATGRLDGVLG
jgi:hypothetical protein